MLQIALKSLGTLVGGLDLDFHTLTLNSCSGTNSQDRRFSSTSAELPKLGKSVCVLPIFLQSSPTNLQNALQHDADLVSGKTRGDR